MRYSNQISTTINQKELDSILNCIEQINQKLPDLITLSSEQLSSIPKASVNTIDFVYEALEFVDKYPELVPEDIEVPEIKKDVELIEAIRKILTPLRRLVRRLEDSALLAGSEAYLPSLAIYNAVKTDRTRNKSLDYKKLSAI
jgi:hypothetical protein